jgi:disulfide bond formation protein DsbB
MMVVVNSREQRRWLNLTAAGATVGLMAYALFLQYVQGLEPCPLCIFQRVAVIALGLVFLAAGLHAPAGASARVYGVLGVLAAVGGVVVAGRHAWLQQLPADQVPACGPGLDYMLEVFPLGEALSLVFQGSGECANVQWSFLGLSMPAWVLLWCAALGIWALAINYRRIA